MAASNESVSLTRLQTPGFSAAQDPSRNAPVIVLADTEFGNGVSQWRCETALASGRWNALHCLMDTGKPSNRFTMNQNEDR
jgi:hypothetical protein